MKRFVAAYFLWLTFLYSSSGDDLSSASSQKKYFEQNFYCHHIIAVDEDGSALLPLVTRSQAADKTFQYKARSIPLAGEDLRGAKVNPAQLQAALKSGDTEGPVPYNSQMVAALEGRKVLYEYLDAMFKSIHRHHPAEVIVYVHGGLNDINGAIAKTALLAETFERKEPGKYFIGICWNSDLMPTYSQHLFSIREGLHQRSKAILTSPAMLLSDFGGAAARMPLNLVNFLYQDIYTIHPEGYKRTQLANIRYTQINSPDHAQPGGLTVRDPGPHADQTTRIERDLNFLSWLATAPVKIPSTLLLDALAAQPWKNMLRRTRTMFERESEFLPQLTYDEVRDLAQYRSNCLHKTVTAAELLNQINSTGRTGAVWRFCDYAQQLLETVGPSRPTITLIGHSMGAIVGCEIVSHFHELPLDNLVFEAAACSIRDFNKEVVPYLEEQNLREKIGRDIQAKYRLSIAEASPLRKTEFYNLCLHDDAENGEKNPWNLDLSQRGSLLTWIDTLYQNPESENDRTLGRWVNAVLSTDFLPKDILNRITIKEFGLNRKTMDWPLAPKYGYAQADSPMVLEPKKHGEFSRFDAGKDAQGTNLEFWSARYRQPEPPQAEHNTIGN